MVPESENVLFIKYVFQLKNMQKKEFAIRIDKKTLNILLPEIEVLCHGQFHPHISRPGALGNENGKGFRKHLLRFFVISFLHGHPGQTMKSLGDLMVVFFITIGK